MSTSSRGEAWLIVDLTEVVIVLNSDEAVKAFSRGGNVTVGGEISISRDQGRS
jgi:lipid-binding SYLF domain-containing protein